MIDSCTSHLSGFLCVFVYFVFLVSSSSRHANVGLTDLMVGEAAQRRMWQGTHSSAVHISHFKHSVGQVEHLVQRCPSLPGSHHPFVSVFAPPSPHLWPHERREHLVRDHLASYPCDGFLSDLVSLSSLSCCDVGFGQVVTYRVDALFFFRHL